MLSLVPWGKRVSEEVCSYLLKITFAFNKGKSYHITNIMQARKTARSLFICTTLTPLIFSPILGNIFMLPKYAWIFLVTALLFAFNLRQNLFNRRNAFIRPAGLFLLWNIALLFRGVNTFSAFYVILLLILFIVFYASFENLLSENPEYDFLLESVCAVTIAVSSYGLLQLIGLDIFNWEFRHSPLSTLGRRNFAAEYIVMVIPYLYYLIYTTRNIRRRKFWLAILTVIMLHLLFTFTRASWIAFLASTLLFIVAMRRGRLLPAGRTAAYLPFILLLLARPSFSAITGFGEGTVMSRLRMYAVSFRMIQDNPFSGVGPGNFAILYPRYASEIGENSLRGGELMITDLHNDPLEIAVELGLPGLLLFLFLIFSAARLTFNLYRKSPGKEKTLIIAIASSITAVLVNSLAAFPFKLPSTTLLFWMNLALLGSISGEQGMARIRHNPHLIKAFFILFTLTGVILYYRGLAASLYIGKAQRAGDRTSLQYAEKAVRYNPFSYEYNFLAGKYAINTGEYDRAFNFLSTAKKYHPYFNVIYNNLGIVYFNTGRPSQAEEAYLYSLKLNPLHADAYNNLGVSFAHAGRYNEAIEYFTEAIEKRKNFYGACFNLGLAYYSKGDQYRARLWFEKTLSIKPDHLAARQYLNKLSSL